MRYLLYIFCLLCFSNKSFSKEYTLFKKKEIDQKQIVIIGSFKKCYAEIREVINHFEKLGGKVLAPIKSEIVDPTADFVLFKDDDITKSEKELQQSVFDKINVADFVYVMNPRYCGNIDFHINHIGIGTASEVGYIIGLNHLRKKQIPIICAYPPASSHIRFFCSY